MQNINKARFFISVLSVILITVFVSLNSELSEILFTNLQTFLSEYLGWLIILLANGFLIFSIFLIFTKYT